MHRVVADTSPLFYLLSIGSIDLLPHVFVRALVPDAVQKELCHPTAPELVRDWAADLPGWVDVRPVNPIADVTLDPLGVGERAAITLALSVHADLILIDERKGTAVALKKGFEATGTLGILRLAARRGFVDLADAFARLKRTNFRYRQEILDALLEQHRRESKG
jgi:predicted nucleic acid-binding protein